MIIFSGFAVDERTLEELAKLSGVLAADDDFFFEPTLRTECQ